MCGMTLRLDPRRPIVWRTPHSLQVGVDPIVARLDDVSEGDTRLIDALVVGVPRSGLDLLAEVAGLAAGRVDAVLAALAGALLTAPAPTDAPRIDVVGTGPGAQRIAAVLLESGYAATLRAPGSRATRRPAPHAVVLVSAHVIDPVEHQRWLRADVLHVPVVFGEAGVRVGPLVDPGASACLASSNIALDPTPRGRPSPRNCGARRRLRKQPPSRPRPPLRWCGSCGGASLSAASALMPIRASARRPAGQ